MPLMVPPIKKLFEKWILIATCIYVHVDQKHRDFVYM